MSRVPPVIPPPPFAVRVPTIAKVAPALSVPETEKTYVPLKLLLLKAPLADATGLVMVAPFPPQATKNESALIATSRTSVWRKDITSPWQMVGTFTFYF